MSSKKEFFNDANNPVRDLEGLDDLFGDLGKDVDIYAEAAKHGIELEDGISPLMQRIIQLGEAMLAKPTRERLVLHMNGEDYRYVSLEEQAEEAATEELFGTLINGGKVSLN